MKKRIVIIHYHPLEYYPPIQNIIKFLQDNFSENNIYIITTATVAKSIKRFATNADNIKIVRFGKSMTGRHPLMRALHYLYFNTAALWQLCIQRPENVLYFETLSSFPVYVYKKYINSLAQVLIHYHEYTSPAEYLKGMMLARKFHNLEYYLYLEAIWISHTNNERMQQFMLDIHPIKICSANILPNYPPASWQKGITVEKKDQKLKIVYAGAIGFDTMYIKEFAVWVEAQNGYVQWDIYSQQDGIELIAYLASLSSRNIVFKGNVSYTDLPVILRQYDVGVILYKGHLPNYIYNAPNKLFEYAACGLDVWFPEQIKGSLPYRTTNTYPKILSLDFQSLNSINIRSLTDRSGCVFKQQIFNYETVLTTLSQKLNG